MKKRTPVSRRTFAPSEELVEKFLRVTFTRSVVSKGVENYSFEDRVTMRRMISFHIEEIIRKFFNDFCVRDSRESWPIAEQGKLSEKVKREIIARFDIGIKSADLFRMLYHELYKFFSKERSRALDACKVRAMGADIVLAAY